MTSQGETGGTQLKPPVEAVRSHYDKSNEFFKLWLDPSMTYSCAYFEERPNMTLEEAQYAKRKLALDKLNLEPGMTLLDIGCGWGSTMRHAVAEYDVNVIGLTLSENQYAHDKAKFEEMDSPRRKEVRIQGWEEFPDEPIDRIVSLGAFEHFADGAGDAGYERYATFFKKYYDLLPDDGRMTIQSSVGYHPFDLTAQGKKLTFELARFIKFIITEIFPGGRLPSTEMMVDHGQKAGFVVPQALSLRPHYIKTLRIWGDTLESNKDKAIEVTSEEVYERYMKYLRGCEHYFTDEMLDVRLVTYLKPGAAA